MPGKIMVGVAGWSYQDWAGIVYPPSLKPGQRLEYLARYFDLVEINTSFYGSIKPAVGRNWCRNVAAVNPAFLFTAKLYRAFTHSPIAQVESTSAQTVRFSEADVKDAKAGLDSIAQEGKLGALLAQFPISFKKSDENRAYLEALANRFQEYPLVVEVRHASWNHPAILSWLTELGVGLCNIDQPLLGRAIHPGARATSQVGYVRLHGRNYKQWFAEADVRDRYDYLYPESELAHWKDRIKTISSRTGVTFVVANNHNLGKAVVNSLELVHMLKGKRVNTPPSLLARYPELSATAAEQNAPGLSSSGVLFPT